jgi:hypothetical protein
MAGLLAITSYTRNRMDFAEKPCVEFSLNGDLRFVITINRL